MLDRVRPKSARRRRRLKSKSPGSDVHPRHLDEGARRPCRHAAPSRSPWASLTNEVQLTITSHHAPLAKTLEQEVARETEITRVGARARLPRAREARDRYRQWTASIRGTVTNKLSL